VVRKQKTEAGEGGKGKGEGEGCALAREYFLLLRAGWLALPGG
jgi:hypothetical protein